MDSREFFDLVTAAPGGNGRLASGDARRRGDYVYFSGELRHQALRGIAEDAPIPEEFVFSPGGKSLPARSYLWVGSAGATTTFHYDDSHNCYAQLIGRKRFWLLPPEAHHSLHLYPQVHPSERQSQVPWQPTPGKWKLRGDAGFKFFAFAKLSRVLVADLKPGDVLLLPATWFHYVEALTPSVSVNVRTSLIRICACTYLRLLSHVCLGPGCRRRVWREHRSQSQAHAHHTHALSRTSASEGQITQPAWDDTRTYMQPCSALIPTL